MDDDSIVEDGTSYCLGTISLYPYMGNSYMDEKEGYLLVPDGNGALIYLDDKEGRFKSGFSSMIYGSDIGFDESDTNNYPVGLFSFFYRLVHAILLSNTYEMGICSWKKRKKTF